MISSSNESPLRAERGVCRAPLPPEACPSSGSPAGPVVGCGVLCRIVCTCAEGARFCLCGNLQPAPNQATVPAGDQQPLVHPRCLVYRPHHLHMSTTAQLMFSR